MMIYEFQVRDSRLKAIPVDQFIEKASFEFLEEYDCILGNESITIGPDGGELPNVFGWDE